MDFKRIVLMVAALCLTVAPTGCLFSPDEDEGGGGGTVTELAFPGTEDQLMANMVTVYEDMDIDGYLEVLDTEFKVYLKQSTIDENNLPQDFFDYETDVQITRNMFSGDAPSETVPGINRVIFSTLTGIETWEDSQDPRFENARFRTYNVHFVFEQGSGTTRQDLTVDGRIDFYVSSEQVMHEGKERTMYRMVGQVDDTND